MKKNILIVLFAAIAMMGRAQVKSGLDLCLRDDKTGEWLIGLFDDFAIYDCHFWDYAKVDKDHYVLTKDGQQKELWLKDNILSIDGVKHQTSVLTSVFLPDYPQKDTCSTFKDTRYQQDIVTIVGWMKDIPQQMKESGNEFSVTVFDDILFDDQHDGNIYTGRIDSLGRFVIKIPMWNSAEVWVEYGETEVCTLLEPGETYFLLYDHKRGKRMFMGRNCRMQNEILAHNIKAEFNSLKRGEISEAKALKFLYTLQTQKANAMKELEKKIATHPNISDRYINYYKGYFNMCEGNNLMKTHFHVKKCHVPAEIMNYAGQQHWQQSPCPYTLYREFRYFLVDYIDQLVYDRYWAYSKEDNKMFRIDDKLYAPILRRYKDAGKVQITDEEMECMERFAEALVEAFRKQEGFHLIIGEEYEKYFNQYYALCNREDIKLILADEKPMCPLYGKLSVLDSIGCNQDLRDIIITRHLYNSLNQDRMPLTDKQMQFFEENVKMQVLKDFLRPYQSYYMGLQQKEFANPTSLKSAGEDMANMSDGEKILRKLIEPYKGKIILLDIWGTWCGPCKEALKHSQEEYEQLKDYDLVYLYLCDKSSDESWKNVIKQYNVTGENVVHYNLPQEQQQAIERFLNVNTFPAYKLIGRNGNILSGNADPREMGGLIKMLDMLK